MSTCSIEIKIKDYFPKTDSIPYQNFICLFTNGESEGQIPLISKDNESYKHQIKNVSSDIKYKIHVLDYNDMSLIGMCEMVISYNVISQITPPNGFIQEQQKKLLMDTNTKRKLFGTVINIGDIYLNIFSEIYLCETKNNINNTKSNCRKKNQLFEGVSRKKIDGSPRTVRKKQLMMQINSDRRALININKNGNNNLEKKQKYKNLTTNNKIDKNMTSINNPNNNNIFKPNTSFNYRDVVPQKEMKTNNNKNNIINNNIYKKINYNNNNNIKNRNFLKNKLKQNTNKNIINKNIFQCIDNEKYKEDNLKEFNMYSRYKTESNKNCKNNNKNLLTKKLEKVTKKQKNKQDKNYLLKSISPKLSRENLNENEDLYFNNNTGNKITTIESLENIDYSGKKYITKEKPKKNNSQNNIASLVNNTLFSTTSTEQEFNDIDKIILEKGTEIRNDFNSQLKNNKKIALNSNINNINLNSNNNTNSSNSNKNNLDSTESDNTDILQSEIKNTFIKLIEFYSLLSRKLLKIRDKNEISLKKNAIYKEKLFNELKKNNSLTQKKTILDAENFMNINNHGNLNEKFLRQMIKMKKLEFKIFQNIFNLFYYEYDILKYKEYENNKKMDEKVKIELLLMVFKNLVKNYGNISHIYLSNNSKITLLKSCFSKYGIEEKENGDNIEIIINNIHQKEKNFEKNKNIEKNENKNDIDKFKVIKEVDEEKEEELYDEDELNSEKNSNNNHASYNNSNVKENNNFCTNEEIKSENKYGKSISGQKKLFENNEESLENKNENKFDNVKYSLSKKIIETEEDNKNNSTEKKEENNNIDKDIKKNEIIEEIIEDESENKNTVKISEHENNIIDVIENENKLPLKNEEDNKNNIQTKNSYNENIKENNELEINNEKEKDEKIKPTTKREIYTRKNRQKYIPKEPEPEPEQIKENNNNIINNEKTYYKKNRIKKEIYDEEDLIMQKILTEDFSKKCKEENKFIRISKYEYSFGEEKIKVEYKDGEVILKLDEGDYKLQEFIDILNEGKNEEDNLDSNNEHENDNNKTNEENIENDNDNEDNIKDNNENSSNKQNIEQEHEQEHKQEQEQEGENDKKIDEKNNSEQKEININDQNENNSQNSNNNSSNSGKKHKKRRKKRVSEDISFEKNNTEREQNSEMESNKKREIVIEKEIDNNYNSDINDINKVSVTEGTESDINSENKPRKYVIKRRRDYKQKNLK